MASEKTTTTGDRFSITVHVTCARKFLRGAEYRYVVEIRDEQEAERAREMSGRTFPDMGFSGTHRFETDDPDALVEVFESARAALLQEVRR